MQCVKYLSRTTGVSVFTFSQRNFWARGLGKWDRVQSQETEMGKGLDSSSIEETFTFGQSKASEFQDLINLDRYSGNQGLLIRKYLKPYRAFYAVSQSSKLWLYLSLFKKVASIISLYFVNLYGRVRRTSKQSKRALADRSVTRSKLVRLDRGLERKISDWNPKSASIMTQPTLNLWTDLHRIYYVSMLIVL